MTTMFGHRSSCWLLFTALLAVVSAPLSSAHAQGVLDGLTSGNRLGGLSLSSTKAEPQLEAVFAPHATETDRVTLRLTLTLPKGSYTYSTNPAFGGFTEIKVNADDRLVPLGEGFVSDHAPKVVFEEDFGQSLEKFEGTVSWSRDFLKSATIERIEGTIKFQVCDSACRVFEKPFSAELSSTPMQPLPAPETPAVSPVSETEAPSDASDTVTAFGSSDETPFGEEPAPPTSPALNSQSTSPVSIEPLSPTSSLGDEGLASFLITAFGAGLLALLTPCVFPMIPVTVSFFLKKAEKKQGNPVVLASVYCLGIMGGFTILGVIMAVFFGATALTALANHPWLNIALAVFLIFFAFNLLGMFEIRVPSSWLNFSASREGQGGILGVLFMALTFTLVSFTCTFGFVGLLLVYASKGNLFWPILGMLTFSLAFALPFFFLALFPSFLASLPKSGGWMNNVKVVLGITEIAFAFKFFSVADLAWHSEPYFFDYGLVMSAWMILAIVAGCYLLGMFRLPHDTATQQISVTKFVFAISFLGFGAYLAQGIFAPKKPTGFVWHNIEAFAPPVLDSASQRDYRVALEYAQKVNRPLLLDFTGVNCINCRKMENTVLSKPQVEEITEKMVLVQLFTDTDAIPGVDDKAKAKEIRAYNLKLQEEWFGDVSLPAYAVVSPDGKILSRLVGYKSDPELFVEFLKQGIDRWQGKDVAMSQAGDSH